MADRAYGAHKVVTDEKKAQYVAEAIRRRQLERRAWSWAEFGIEEGGVQEQLVRQAYSTLRVFEEYNRQIG